MATDKPRFSITLDESTLEQVLTYKKQNNISTQSKAIQRLIELGISDLGFPPPSPSDTLTPAEHTLVADYRDATEEIRDSAADMLHKSAERNRQERRKTG